tara:strand:+ start:278 stop:826 length:549 start_codon:yes stop_codon:yes gene_type:complete
MIVIDNFIKDIMLLEEIQLSKDFFGPNGDFMWWDGWWNSKANTLKKKLIEYIWCENSPDKSYDISGFEYWTGVYGNDMPNTNLGNHFDKDELHFQNTGEIVRPVVGTIFYPKDTKFEGGYLEIENEGKTERIQAKSNRLVIFDAGHDLHRVTEVTKGIRYAIAINLWLSPPSAVINNSITLE